MNGNAEAPVPIAATLLCNSTKSLSVRETTTTLTPYRTSVRADVRPIPFPASVTTALILLISIAVS